jgi:hypothetical protein
LGLPPRVDKWIANSWSRRIITGRGIRVAQRSARLRAQPPVPACDQCPTSTISHREIRGRPRTGQSVALTDRLVPDHQPSLGLMAATRRSAIR